jgi:hypothetical protein
VISAVVAVAETPVRARRPRRARPAAPVEVSVKVSMAAPAPVSASLAGLPQVDPAALDPAMKILSRQTRRLEITADMVGMTLAYQGEVVLIGAMPVATPAAAPAPAAALANAQTALPRKRVQPSATRVNCQRPRNAEVKGLVLRALAALGG